MFILDLSIKPGLLETDADQSWTITYTDRTYFCECFFSDVDLLVILQKLKELSDITVGTLHDARLEDPLHVVVVDLDVVLPDEHRVVVNATRQFSPSHQSDESVDLKLLVNT